MDHTPMNIILSVSSVQSAAWSGHGYATGCHNYPTPRMRSKLTSVQLLLFFESFKIPTFRSPSF